MAELLTLHLTNWASRRLHGPGRRWTIMAAPRAWERGDGAIAELTPARSDLVLLRSLAISEATYRERFDARVAARTAGGCGLRPGLLVATVGLTAAIVESGDTLLCACARSAAALGRCHRVWAAGKLVAAGWRVILDGWDLVSVERGRAYVGEWVGPGPAPRTPTGPRGGACG